MGTGYVLRSAAELFLIGILGAPRTKNKGQRNFLLTGDWPRGGRKISTASSLTACAVNIHASRTK